jgi:hypothetical protein
MSRYEKPDPTPATVQVDLKKPETIEETVRRHVLKQQYFQNLNAIAAREKAGEDIDDEYSSDEEAFTAAENEYIKSQEDFKEKKEKFFKAAQEKSASEMAKKQALYKKQVQDEAKKLGLINEVDQPKASDSAQGNKD